MVFFRILYAPDALIFATLAGVQAV